MSEEEKVLLALSELEPTSLDDMVKASGVGVQRLRQIFKSLAKKGLLRERKGYRADEVTSSFEPQREVSELF